MSTPSERAEKWHTEGHLVTGALNLANGDVSICAAAERGPEFEKHMEAARERLTFVRDRINMFLGEE